MTWRWCWRWATRVVPCLSYLPRFSAVCCNIFTQSDEWSALLSPLKWRFSPVQRYKEAFGYITPLAVRQRLAWETFKTGKNYCTIVPFLGIFVALLVLWFNLFIICLKKLSRKPRFHLMAVCCLSSWWQMVSGILTQNSWTVSPRPLLPVHVTSAYLVGIYNTVKTPADASKLFGYYAAERMSLPLHHVVWSGSKPAKFSQKMYCFPWNYIWLTLKRKLNKY